MPFLLLQLSLKLKLDSLQELQKLPNHVEVLEKVLLDSAAESFTSELHVSCELMFVAIRVYISLKLDVTATCYSLVFICVRYNVNFELYRSTSNSSLCRLTVCDKNVSVLHTD